MITQVFIRLKLVVGSLNLCYVRSIHGIISVYGACKCSNNVYDFLSGSAAAASFLQACCHHVPATPPPSKNIRGKNQHYTQSLPFQSLSCGIYMPNAAPSPYIIEGKDFSQNSLIFPMTINHEPPLFKPS